MITVKELDTNNHSVFMLHYHLVMCTKYRRKVIDDDISNRLKEIFLRIADSYNIVLEEWNHDIDHVHKISDKNREVIESDVNSLIEQGYEPAQCCVND